MMLKILTFNMHKGMGWLPRNSTFEKMRKQLNVLKPDLIFLQEICGGQFESLAAHHFSYHTYGKNVVHQKGHHGNAIMSKYPILASNNVDISIGSYEKRSLLHTIINTDESKLPIHLICVHLGLLKSYRQQQFHKIAAYVEENIPSKHPLIISGDFNDWGNHAAEHMHERLGLLESFQSEHGHHAKTFPAWMPILRLDRIYSRGFEVCSAERLVKQEWKQLSDHIALNVKLKIA